jgi:hypothetical protein
MSVKIKIDENHIKTVIDDNWNNGLAMLSAIILTDCNKFCKMDTGMLVLSSLIHSDLKHGRLIWNTPYAARQYYEIPTAYTDVNSKASWRWCEVAKNLYQDDWGRQAQAIMRLYSK